MIRDTGMAFNAFGEPSSWGIGSLDHGSPGVADPSYFLHFEGWRYDLFDKTERNDPMIGMIDSDPDGDGRNNWVEYCFGSNPRVKDLIDVQHVTAESGGQPYFAQSFKRRRNAFDIAWSLRSSDDMVSWVEDGSILHGSPQLLGSELEKITLRSNTRIDGGGRKFFRVQGVRR